MWGSALRLAKSWQTKIDLRLGTVTLEESRVFLKEINGNGPRIGLEGNAAV